MNILLFKSYSKTGQVGDRLAHQGFYTVREVKLHFCA